MARINVYFLNLVDEANLFALLNKEKQELNQSSSDTDVSEKTSEKEEEKTATEESNKTEKKSGNMLPIIIVILLMAGAGGGYFYLKSKKKRPKPSAVIPMMIMMRRILKTMCMISPKAQMMRIILLNNLRSLMIKIKPSSF